MKILALEREKPDLNPAEVQPHLMDEAHAAWKLLQEGVFREMYFTVEEHTAVIMLEANSAQEASELLKRLPLVRKASSNSSLSPCALMTVLSVCLNNYPKRK